jgi:hypothetical protein
MISKKGQAALEFLMTYGWAILVVLVSIGALAYFGVLSPERFLPAKCTLQSGITCLDHKATGSGASTGFTAFLQNNLGQDIDQIVVGAGGCGNYPGTVGSTGVATMANGGQGTFFIPCTFTSTSKYSGQLNVSYRIVETGITHNNVGSVVTRIE